MSAPIFAVDSENPQPRVIEKAVALLAAGGLVAYPTDSSYGLGCDLGQKRAVDRLYQLKGGDRKRPMSLMVGSLSEATDYARVSNFAFRVLRHLAPGPFTFVLEATRRVPQALQTKQCTVGLRIPASPVVRELCARLGRPLVTTTARQPEGEPLIGADDVAEVFGHGLALVLDGGVQHNQPSTILSLLGDRVELLRQGQGDASSVLTGSP